MAKCRNNFIIYVLLVITVIFVFVNRAQAQFQTKYSVSFGVNTLSILGDNPAVKPMYSSESSDFGAGFNAPQTGFSLRFFMTVDEDERFVVPFGMDYNFFRGAERYPIAKFISVHRKNEIDIPTVVAGLHYNLVRWPLANAKAYIGIEARGTFLPEGRIEDKIHYYFLDSTVTISENTKSSTFRLGGALRLGVEGQLHKRLFVNFNGAIGIMNLVGLDDERGELLTPFKKMPYYLETKESFVYLFQYQFSLLYKL